MKVNNIDYRTVWYEAATNVVCMIEQNLLPFEFKIARFNTYEQTCHAIKTMVTRGAGAIGATAGFAMAQAAVVAPESTKVAFLEQAKIDIEATRPTAQNLFWATSRVFAAAQQSIQAAIAEAQQVADDDAFTSKMIGKFGNELIADGMSIATHCNAGWLAFVDHGTALSPVYAAHRLGKKVFVYADETRPRSQGARLTAWELKNEGVPHTILPDNATAYMMMQGKIDMMIVGADRIAANGDVANKIGTLEKAIAAKEFGVPFYVAAPSSTFDLDCVSGAGIPIEERSQDEVLYQIGIDNNGVMHKILVCSPGSTAYNLAFDVTPAKYITGIITEKGVIKPSEVRDKIAIC